MSATDCAEVLSHLWEYLDGELAVDSSEPIRAHLAICPRCGLAYAVDGALLRRVARLEIVTLAAPEPLVRRVELLIERR